MSMKSDLFAYLKTKTGVTDLLDTGNDMRFYDKAAPASAALPYVTFNRISGTHDHHMLGAGGLAGDDYQLSVFDNDGVGAEAVAQALRNALDGYRGIMNSGTNVRRCFLTGNFETYNPADDSSQVGTHQISQTYEIDRFESIPTLV